MIRRLREIAHTGDANGGMDSRLTVESPKDVEEMIVPIPTMSEDPAQFPKKDDE